MSHRGVGWAAAIVLVAGLVAGASFSGSKHRPTVASREPTVTTTVLTTTTLAPATTTTAAPAPPIAQAQPADDPVQLAARLDKVDAVLVDPASTDAELAAAGSRQQLAILQLSLDPDLRSRVEPRLSPATKSWLDATLQAGDALASIVPPRTDLPPWRVLPPQPAATLLSYYREGQAASGVPWQYLAAIHLVETRMGRIHGNSTANAQGPMQFLPSTWARYGHGGDIQSDHDSILAAARFLVANGAANDMRGALRHYNQSDGYVTAVTLYAQQMQVNERYYYGFYNWQVLYKHVSGRLILPPGYPDVAPVPVVASLLAGQ